MTFLQFILAFCWPPLEAWALPAQAEPQPALPMTPHPPPRPSWTRKAMLTSQNQKNPNPTLQKMTKRTLGMLTSPIPTL